MDFELQDVILDVVIQHEDPPHRPEESALARIDFFKSRLVFESFSDGSRDVDLVSREILLSDLRFVDCPANKRANVFSQILRPMEVAERNNPLQAEVHFRATQDTNRFTILLNNMRLMGIFDWWLAVLDFINKAADNPAAAAMLVQSGRSVSESDEEESAKKAKKDEKTMIVMQEEPLYPSAGKKVTMILEKNSLKNMDLFFFRRNIPSRPGGGEQGSGLRAQAEHYRL